MPALDFPAAYGTMVSAMFDTKSGNFLQPVFLGSGIVLPTPPPLTPANAGLDKPVLPMLGLC